MNHPLDDDHLPVVRASDITETVTGPRWMIESLWARAGVGILGGAPKCCKSWTALEMALAVTSGAPFLGDFPTHDRGPALLYMAEDAAPLVKARLSGICRHRGLLLHELELHLITAAALRLDRSGDQSRLRDAIDRYKPRLLVLDPFVRLHRIDENDAGQVSALLGYLRELQREYDVAIMVVHHARKNGGSQPGQSLRGSGDFFAWADSLLHVHRHRGQLILTVEHRNAPAPQPINLRLAGDHDVHLEVQSSHPCNPAEPDPQDALDTSIIDALTAAAQPMPRADLRQSLHVRNKRLGDALLRLAQAGRVLQIGNRWSIPETHTP